MKGLMTMIKNVNLPLTLYEGEGTWSSSDSDTYVHISINADQLSANSDTSFSSSINKDESLIFNQSGDLGLRKVKKRSSSLTDINIKPYKSLNTNNDNRISENDVKEKGHKLNVFKNELWQFSYESVEETINEFFEEVYNNVKDTMKLSVTNSNYKTKEKLTNEEPYAAHSLSNQSLKDASNNYLYLNISSQESSNEAVTSVDELRENILPYDIIETNSESVTRGAQSQKLLSFDNEIQQKVAKEEVDKPFVYGNGKKITQKTLENNKGFNTTSIKDIIYLNQPAVVSHSQSNVTPGTNFESNEQPIIVSNDQNNVTTDPNSVQPSLIDQLAKVFLKIEIENRSSPENYTRELLTPDFSDLSNASVNMNIQKIDINEDLSKESIENIDKEFDVKMLHDLELGKVNVSSTSTTSDTATKAATEETIDVPLNTDLRGNKSHSRVDEFIDIDMVHNQDYKMDISGVSATSEKTKQTDTEGTADVSYDTDSSLHKSLSSEELVIRIVEDVVQHIIDVVKRDIDVVSIAERQTRQYGRDSGVGIYGVSATSKETTEKDSEDTTDVSHDTGSRVHKLLSGEELIKKGGTGEDIKRIDIDVDDNKDYKVDVYGVSATSKETTEKDSEDTTDVSHDTGSRVHKPHSSEELFMRTVEDVVKHIDDDVIDSKECKLCVSNVSAKNQDVSQITKEEVIDAPRIIDSHVQTSDDKEEFLKGTSEDIVKPTRICMPDNIQENEIDFFCESPTNEKMMIGNVLNNKMIISGLSEAVEDFLKNKDDQEKQDDVVHCRQESDISSARSHSRNKSFDNSGIPVVFFDKRNECKEYNDSGKSTCAVTQQLDFERPKDKSGIETIISPPLKTEFQCKRDEVKLPDTKLHEIETITFKNELKIDGNVDKKAELFCEPHLVDACLDDDTKSISVELDSLSNHSLSFSTEKIFFDEFQDIYDSELTKTKIMENAFKELEVKTEHEFRSLNADCFSASSFIDHNTGDSSHQQEGEEKAYRLVTDAQKSEDTRNNFRQTANLYDKNISYRRLELCPGEDYRDSNMSFELFQPLENDKALENNKFTNTTLNTSEISATSSSAEKINKTRPSIDKIRFKSDPSSGTTSYKNGTATSSLSLNTKKLNLKQLATQSTKSVQPVLPRRPEANNDTINGEKPHTIPNKDKSKSTEPFSSESPIEVSINLQSLQSDLAEDDSLQLMKTVLTKKEGNRRSSSSRKKVKIFETSDYQIYMEKMSSGSTSSIFSLPQNNEQYLCLDSPQSCRTENPPEEIEIIFCRNYERLYNSNNNMDMSSIRQSNTSPYSNTLEYDEPFNESEAMILRETSPTSIEEFANCHNAVEETAAIEDDSALLKGATAACESGRELFSETDLSVEVSINLFSKMEQSMETHADIVRTIATPSEADDMTNTNDFADGDKDNSLMRLMIEKIKSNSNEASSSFTALKETFNDLRFVRELKNTWRSFQRAIQNM